jgi:lysophospholipid acyltransferase (LPLAT)-like uncharacterized protein
MSAGPDAFPTPRKTLRSRFWGWVWTQVLRIVSATWKEDHEGLHKLDELLENNHRYIMMFWHRKFITLFPILRGRPVCVATAASPPGDVIANMCDRFGYSHIQIPDNGKLLSLQLMEDAFAHAAEGIIAVDGPHGPYHAVKWGTIQAASDLGYLIVPVSIDTRRKIVLSHRWDQLEIPGLFTRVSMIIGEPIKVPPDIPKEELPVWTQRLQDVLENLDECASKKVHEL